MDHDAVAERLRRLRSRTGTYGALLAPVVITLLLGLLLPFAVGDPIGGRDVTGDTEALDVLGGTRADESTGTDPGRPTVPAAANRTVTTEAGAGSIGTSTTMPVESTPGDDGATGSEQEPATGPPTSVGPLGASDVGVTPDAVRVAVLVPNLGGFAGAGFAVDLGDSRAAFSAFFQELNQAGGVHGRMIEASYIDFDPLQDSSMRAACLTATEDQKVFATMNVNGFYGPGILCVGEEHRTPLVQAYYSDPAEWYERTDHLYITAYPSKDRALRNLVHEMHSRGALDGRTIGIVDSDYPFDKSASENTLIPTLRSLGYEVAHRSTLSSDTATSQSQIPIEVQQMQAAGVDTIFFAVYFVYVSTWVQQASNRQYFPQYLQSDFANGTSDGGTSQMPEGYDGAIGVTSTRVGERALDRPVQPVTQDCIDRWNRLTGTPLEPGGADETIMVGACGSVDAFAAAASSQGADLTRTGLRDGFMQLGRIEFPLLAPITWGPGKTDGGDQVRIVRWHFERDGEECKCWIPVDEFRPVRGPS